MRFSLLNFTTFFVLVFFPGLVFAEDTSSDIPTIRVTGEASIQVMPDQAQVQIFVVTEDKTADRASGQNARITEKVLSELREIVEPGSEIKTTGFRLQPVYETPKGAPRRIAGYKARNHISVRTRNLALVGKIIDGATEAGANEIGSIQFTLKDEHAVRLKALRLATANAMEKAEGVAATLGVKVRRVYHVEEQGGRVHRPIVERGIRLQSTSARTPTPVEPGLIEVRESVTLTAEISQKK